MLYGNITVQNLENIDKNKSEIMFDQEYCNTKVQQKNKEK